MRFLKKYLPIILIVALWLSMVVTNYKSGTWLVGWDNTVPELNYEGSIAKTLTGIWQEYRGLGLLDGMAHAANIVHLGMIFLLDIFLPKQIVRYVFILGMNLLGGLGVYFLGNRLLKKEDGRKEWISVFGALFYMFNIGVVQMFFIPLELFVIHFGFLPWLIIVLMNLLQDSSKKNILWFVVINLLAVSQAHVPSIFIVYGIVVISFLIDWIIRSKKKGMKIIFKKLGLVIGLLFLINAFWGIPYFYSTFSNASKIVSSKINQMSNQEIILSNEAFGDFKSVAMMKGFNFKYYDAGNSGVTVPLMNEWLIHFDHLGTEIISLTFFGLSILGIVNTFVNKKREVSPITYVFLFAFLMLGSEIPVLSSLSWLLKEYVPFFAEIFRFAFTKFIIIYGLGMSILIILGLDFLSNKIFKKNMLKIILLGLVGLSLGYLVWPIWKGEFIYSRMKEEIPNEYFEVFEYFKQIDKSKRIAVLPSPNYWGWTTNDWGYRGSGFVWYGIEQAMMDRAFDAWSGYNEQYYWELNYAISIKDELLLSNVFKKYDIDYILYDSSVINTTSEKEIMDEKELKFIDGIDGIELKKDLGTIKIFGYSEEENRSSYISILENYTSVNNSFEHAWEDISYRDYGDYVFNNTESNIVYVFDNLFTNRLQFDINFQIKDDGESLYLSNDISKLEGNYSFEIPNIIETEEYLPIRVIWTRKNKLLEIKIETLSPRIEIGNSVYVANKDWEGSLDMSRCGEDCYLRINYIDNILLDSEGGEIETLIKNKEENVIGINDGEDVNFYDYLVLDARIDLTVDYEWVDEESDGELKVEVAKIKNDNYNLGIVDSSKYNEEIKSCGNNNEYGVYEKRAEGEGIVYKAVDNSACENIYLDFIDHRQSYILKIRSENISSIPFKFGVQNSFTGRSEIDTLLSDKNEDVDNWIVIPRTEKFNKGYNLFFNTASYGREVNENKLSSIEVNWLPYNFLKELKLIRSDYVVEDSKYCSSFDVNKKAVWFYEVRIGDECDVNSILKLSQSYDDGWIAFYMDGVKPSFLSHVKVSNWANGWKLDEIENKQVYIVFWPQLLEYLGFGMLIGLGAWLGVKRK